MFQSLIGRLKTAIARTVLRPFGGAFQSLIGRLKTQFPLEVQAKVLEFQSLIGRLKTRLAAGEDRERAVVSIPHR